MSISSTVSAKIVGKIEEVLTHLMGEAAFSALSGRRFGGSSDDKDIKPISFADNAITATILSRVAKKYYPLFIKEERNRLMAKFQALLIETGENAKMKVSPIVTYQEFLTEMSKTLDFATWVDLLSFFERRRVNPQLSDLAVTSTLGWPFAKTMVQLAETDKPSALLNIKGFIELTMDQRIANYQMHYLPQLEDEMNNNPLVVIPNFMAWLYDNAKDEAKNKLTAEMKQQVEHLENHVSVLNERDMAIQWLSLGFISMMKESETLEIIGPDKTDDFIRQFCELPSDEERLLLYNVAMANTRGTMDKITTGAKVFVGNIKTKLDQANAADNAPGGTNEKLQRMLERAKQFNS